MTTTGATAASTQFKFSRKQLLRSLVPPSTATPETSINRTISITRSLRRRFTSPSVLDCLKLTGGITSSGGWITCKSIRFGTKTLVVDRIHSYIGSVDNWAKAVLLWNIALDSNGQPLLPGTRSCQNPSCRGAVTIDGGSYTLNEECEFTFVHRLRCGLTGSLARSLCDGTSVSRYHS